MITLCFICWSCDADDEATKRCDFQELPGINDPAPTVIPLNSQNFWVYADSVWENGSFVEEKSTLLIIDKVYDFNGKRAIRFSTILPLFTIREDMLVSSQFTPGPETDDCYQELFPMLFATEDTVVVEQTPVIKQVYKNTAPVSTLSGSFLPTYTYSEGEVFEITTFPELGVVFIGFYTFDANGSRRKSRTLTLKDYQLY